MRPDIDGIQARTEAATPGPWKWYWMVWGLGMGDSRISETDGYLSSSNGAILQAEATEPDDDGYVERWLETSNPADPDFIAHARKDIPDLLAYIKRLEEGD